MVINILSSISTRFPIYRQLVSVIISDENYMQSFAINCS